MSGGEILTTLLQLQDVVGQNDADEVEKLQEKLDALLDGVVDFPEDNEQTVDHDYLDRPVDKAALTVLAGCVARKVQKLQPAASCGPCSDSLIKDKSQEVIPREEFLAAKSRGGLLVPSVDLYQLIYQLGNVDL